MSEPHAAEPFLVAGWLVDPRANELSRSGATHRLEPKVMDVLVALAERAGEPITREALLERVWPGVFVSESALSRCVSQLRKLFDDDPREPAVIETLSKVGYRLVAPVGPAYSGDSLSARSPASDGVPPGVSEVTLSVAPYASAARPPRRRMLLAGAAVATALLTVGPAVVLSGRLDRAPAPAIVTPITTTRNPETNPAPSPDGSRVAFAGSGAEEGNQDIYVQVLGASAPLRLTTDPDVDSAPAWSPDGREIAFIRCAGIGQCAIRVVSALGGDERRLLDGVAGWGGLAWSPDGRTLAYGAPEPEGQQTAGGPAQPRRASLWLLDIATGRTRRLTTPPRGVRGDGQPRFSPNGSLVAFRRDIGPGFADLHVVPTPGGSPRALTDDGRFLAGHTWTADGRSVVFSSDRNGLFQLWSVAAAGGAPVLLRGVPTRDPGGPAVAQGGRLLFEEWDFETDIWRVTPGAPAAQLVTSTWRDLHPHASSDGRLAFASDRSGAWEIWTTLPDGTSPARLTRLEGPAALHPRWSPDGRRIAFEVRDAGRAGVFVVDADGGIPRAVTPEGMDAIVPRWSRDGRALYVSSRRAGRWEIWRVPLSGGEPTQITSAGGYAAEELGDGRIVYSKYGGRGLYARDLAGGAERLLYSALSPVDGTNWWLEGEQLAVPVRDAEGVHLLRVDAGTGGTTRIPGSIDGLGGGEATLAPLPGGGVAYTRTMRVEADLVVAEPFDGR